jgi:hypothetical protein
MTESPATYFGLFSEISSTWRIGELIARHTLSGCCRRLHHEGVQILADGFAGYSYNTRTEPAAIQVGHSGK